MKSLAVVLLLFLGQTASAESFLSPLRHRGESFESAVQRQSTRADPRILQSHSAYEARAKLTQLDQRVLPSWNSNTPIEVAFREIRDRRTLEDPTRSNFLRRVSWLYPDDGCYARAEIAAQWLEEMGYPSPAKVFVFGSLRAKTAHHPQGKVRWWYHVVVGYKTAAGLMVFDPAVWPEAPMTLKAWGASLGDEVTYSFCDRNSVDPYSTCVGGSPENAQATYADEMRFLNSEWKRQIELRRDPYRVLGEEPPWRKTGSVLNTELLVP